MGISPRYTIHQYREDLYKVVAFKGNRDPELVHIRTREEEQHYDAKLNEAYCRAKSMVLQYALCNPWDYFFTGTLDARKFNRFALDTYQEKLSQFIRDKRKSYATQIQFLLVPEQHQDGAWHIHGLLSGLPPSALRKFCSPEPQDLVHRSFLNWPDYMNKFGFCSLGQITSPVATAFYITKYVSKELSRRGGDLGKHLYFHSRPLKKAEKAADVYYYNPALDNYCIHDHEFCKTGMVQQAPWYFPYQWDGADVVNVAPLDPPPQLLPEATFHPRQIDPLFDQQKMEGFFPGGQQACVL